MVRRQTNGPVRCKDECRAALADLGQRVPQMTTSDRVHAGCGFVQEHDGWLTDQRHSGAQLALVATAAQQEITSNRIKCFANETTVRPQLSGLPWI